MPAFLLTVFPIQFVFCSTVHKKSFSQCFKTAIYPNLFPIFVYATAPFAGLNSGVSH
jgi:hypothetical protein